MNISRNRPPSLSGANRPVRPRSPSEALEPTRAPKRPKGARARRARRPVNGLVRFASGFTTAILMAMVLVGGTIFLINSQYDAAGPLTEARALTVRSGEGRLEIAKKLEAAGVIQSRQLFIINHFARNTVRWLSGKPWRDLKAGEYEFKPGASMRAVLSAVAKGRTVLYSVTVPEGLTSQQIVRRVLNTGDLIGELAQVPTEGSLLPETYRFTKGSERTAVIKRMQDASQIAIKELWQTRDSDLPISTMDEAVILASIVEKETGRNSERKRVAAVFINRMRKGMRLESDPTIIYGITGGAGPLGRPIYQRDIKKKTPYNTYHIKGLPPTPICNPGRAAIEAVLHPAQTEEIFFVADGTGGHQFSKTLKEHNAAVANWRQIEKKARARAKAEEKARKLAAKDAPATATSAQPGTEGTIPLPSQTATDALRAAGTANGGALKTVTTLAVNANATSASTNPKTPSANSDTGSTETNGIPLPVRKPH